MIYVYSCPTCKTEEEIIKSVAFIDSPEQCKQGHTMDRILSWSGQMKKGDLGFEPHFSYAFGKKITNPGQIKDELRREKYEKGIELVEVGNERPSYTPKRQEYDYESAGKELYKILKK